MQSQRLTRQSVRKVHPAITQNIWLINEGFRCKGWFKVRNAMMYYLAVLEITLGWISYSTHDVIDRHL